MKTKDVIKELEHMNLQAEIRGNDLFVVHSGREDIASVNLNTRFEINTSYWAFKNLLSEDEREKVYVLLTKLAETDPQDRGKDRGEEKKYYLKHKWLAGDNNYLNFNSRKYNYELNSYDNFDEFKTEFTQSEIDALKKYFNTKLEDFELIEVVD